MKRFCSKPFENLEVMPDGTSFACCPGWLPRPIGNVLDGPRKVWNSLHARDIRLAILDGSFRRCTACPLLSTATGSVKWVADDADLSAFQLEPARPKFLNLAIDKACNLACLSCRTEKHRSSAEDRARVRDVQAAALSDGILAGLEWLSVSGSGDPFASGPHLELLRSLSPEQYPNLKIKLHTNGLLLNCVSWEALGSARSMVKAIEISVDAATSETYTLNRGGDWPTLMRNLSFVSGMRSHGALETFQLSFCAQANNWREIPAFIELGIKLGVDVVFVSALRNWGTFSEDEFRVRAAHLLGHADRLALREMLAEPRCQDTRVTIAGLLDG